MKIREVHENKKQFIALLLLADQQENMFIHYLEIEYGKKSIGKPLYHFEQLKIICSQSVKQLKTPIQDFYNPIPAFVGYERMCFTLTFQMYCWI